MAEDQLKHEHRHARLTLFAAKFSEISGITAAFVLVMVTIVGAFALLWAGRDTEAAKVFLTGVATVCGGVGLNQLITISTRKKS